LLDLFKNAHRLRDLAVPSPLARVSLYRLLLAILYRTQQIDVATDWKRLWEEGWDLSAIIGYLEKWEDRFDLFSERYPFFQRPDLDLGDKVTPVSKLSHEFAAGNNKQLFDHSRDDDPPALTAAHAARLLVACQGWAIGGGISGGGRPRLTSAALPKAASLVIIGGNLAETLLLNLVPKSKLAQGSRRILRDGADDRPSWERAGEEMVDERSVDGPTDYLTWQSRYIRLIPSEEGTVRFTYFAQGEKMATGPDGSGPIDLFHAYEERNGKEIPKGLNPDKAVWRDAESLFAMVEEGKSVKTIPALASLASQGSLRKPVPDPATVLVAGIAVPQGQPPPDLWCASVFRVPVDLVRDNSAYDRLHHALSLAQEAAKVLRVAVFVYAESYLHMLSGAGDPAAVRKLTDALCRETDYWASLEAPFHAFLPRVSDPDPPVGQWQEAARTAAENAFLASMASQDATGRHLRAENAARARFYGRTKGINALIPKEVTLDV
jgi:CRISPR system Cascade subunit CasA